MAPLLPVKLRHSTWPLPCFWEAQPPRLTPSTTSFQNIFITLEMLLTLSAITTWSVFETLLGPPAPQPETLGAQLWLNGLGWSLCSRGPWV